MDHQQLTLLQLFYDARITDQVTVAAVTLVVFDYLLTIGKEVDLIWKNLKSLASMLYIWSRYFSMIALAINISFMFREIKTNRECTTFFHIEGITFTVLVSTVDLVLLLRVWLLYGKSRTVRYFLLPMVVGEFVSMITLNHYAIDYMKVFVHLGPALLGCWTLHIPSFYTYMSVPGLIVSFIMFAMTVYKCFPRSAPAFHANRRQTVSSLFLRDGIMWFLAVFVIMISQTVIVAGARMSLGAVMISMGISAYSVICCRVLLNIKEHYAGPGDEARTTRMWIGDSTLGVAHS